MPNRPFYADGLRFSCTRCSSCCRYDPGYVFLSKNDLEALAAEQGLTPGEFISVYCRWVPGNGELSRLSLKERSNYDCIFWKDGCTVYEKRPVRCRTFPFWQDVLQSPSSWESVAQTCPGMGKGVLHTQEDIEFCLGRGLEETVVSSEPIVMQE
ncbi:zinc/iron-chelating domain-containing protein [Spirochaetia bacterium]|nr:zinc/iron-chelating domain-containing protein [Spirochaetia bacterium]